MNFEYAVGIVLSVLLCGYLGYKIANRKPVAVSIAYATLAISMWLLPRFRAGAAPQALARPTSTQWLATIGAELALFTKLHDV